MIEIFCSICRYIYIIDIPTNDNRNRYFTIPCYKCYKQLTREEKLKIFSLPDLKNDNNHEEIYVIEI